MSPLPELLTCDGRLSGNAALAFALALLSPR
jgi:hypothetical protein